MGESLKKNEVPHLHFLFMRSGPVRNHRDPVQTLFHRADFPC